MKKLLTLIICFFVSVSIVQATHIMGGEITWECLSNGQFVFTVKFYRDCNGISFGGAFGDLEALEIRNYPSQGSPVYFIDKYLISQTDISPQCNIFGPGFHCSDGNSASPLQGLVEELVFRTDTVVLTGVPPPEGWIISFDGCCRNAGITNFLNSENEGYVLRAKMFAYNFNNTGECFDSSPVFAEKPVAITCGGYPALYYSRADEPDGDSLAYSWAESLDDFYGEWNNINPAILTYTSGYSYDSPFPGTTQNPSNIPPVLNHNEGDVFFTSYTAGNFVSVIKVESWRNGIKIAEVYREMQTLVLPNCANSPPDIQSPFVTASPGFYKQYTDTVVAGDLATLTITASDNGLLANSNPQSVKINGYAEYFGAGLTNDSVGCPYPPCAVFQPAPAYTPTNNSVQFNWQTTGDHISWNDQYTTHVFNLLATDDYCSLPGNSYAKFNLVLDNHFMDFPGVESIFIEDTGDVTLTWEEPPRSDPDFMAYYIYHSTTYAGPFVLLDSVTNYNTTTYTHIGAAESNANHNYYKLATKSVYNNKAGVISSKILEPIHPLGNITGNNILLHWNSINPADYSNNYWYRVYRENTPGSWLLLDSTQNIFYLALSPYCNSSVRYRVETNAGGSMVSNSTYAFNTVTPHFVHASFSTTGIGTGTVDFHNNSTYATSYQWDFGVNGISTDVSTDQNPSYTYPEGGTYAVTLIASSSCSSDTIVHTITGVGIEEEAATISDVIVYPNPFSGETTIQLTLNERTDLNVSVYTMEGKKIANVFTGKAAKGTTQLNFDSQLLSSGIYFARIVTDNAVRTVKLMVK